MKLPRWKNLVNQERGFTPILIIIVVAILILGLGYVYSKKLIPPSTPKSETSPSSKPSITSSSTPQPASNWKSYTNTYAGFTIQYPGNWIANPCLIGEGGGEDEDCNEFGPPDSKIAQDVIELHSFVTKDEIPSGTPNFTLTPVGNTPNAYFINDSKELKLYFKYRGIGQYYILETGYDHSNFSLDTLEPILKQMAQSLIFIQPNSTSCGGPATLPLSDFPDQFSLSNYHNSDGQDSVTAVLSDNQNSPEGQEQRRFLVDYYRSDFPFEDNPSFDSKVALINPGQDSFDTGATTINYVNCPVPDLSKTGDYESGPFHLSTKEGDPYGVVVYGSSSNPTTLWSKDQWNINLLKQTRNEVYVKRGSKWQKYEAYDYNVYQSSCCFAGKPAIYLYPQKTEPIQVRIQQTALLATDTLYNSQLGGWNVSANPSGIINNSLPYLYYEAKINIPQPQTGYVVSYSDLFPFTHSYIQKLGLNQAEAAEFIKFWKEKLPYSPYYFVSHLTADQINYYYPLSISPNPDTLIRVEIYFKPVSQNFQVTPPTLPKVPQRNGFSAVEWGGILNSP